MNWVTAQVRGCWRPKPPALMDMEVISSACGGRGSDSIALCKKEFVMSLKPFVMSLFQRK